MKTAPPGAAQRDVNFPFLRTGDVAFAARVPRKILLEWFDRGQVSLIPEDHASSGTGENRRLTLRTAYRIAIIADLYRLGLPVRKGAVIAAKFADHGNPGRDPGRLYDARYPTYLLALGSADTAECCPHGPMTASGAPASLSYNCEYAVTAVHAGLGIEADPPGYQYPPEADDE
ncbi:MAG: hypothetical protein B7Z40_18340 [Bosea sp. 12-68-7]|nr:MAG: hypothetical protein B7Z40_18340 [Bosea sp. 12-68-7]